uniref:UPF0577 protein KIAA1324-like n=1 Tax=Sinocyclocheilus rhinocerous TaxID=307959 RepID=A0A673LTW7_9TELE
ENHCPPPKPFYTKLYCVDMLRFHRERADYYFQYTECDSTGSRWRVAIPLNPGECTGLPEPVQGTDCTFSCKAGEFLEMSAQECTLCAAGTYSLGSGLRFDEWDDIPPGFSSLATNPANAPNGQNASTCSSAKWVAQGSYLESNRDECTVSLIYTVHLKKPGSVSFDYQYVDNSIFFEFFIQNDQCQEMDQESNKKWIKLTTHGEWGTHIVNLNSGTNILYWRTTRVTLGSKAVKPVVLKNIRIEGVAYTSECFPCNPGTFSRAPGSSSCESCPRDTYSGRGASSCTPCNTKTHFACKSEGSAACKSRPPCSEKDYIQTYSTCDKDGKTQVIYKWVEPQICLEAAAGAATLPPSGQREPCPPCNPGFYNNDTATCSPCPSGTSSDGVKACQPCPAGTEPVLGYEYKWWNVLPANMKTSCFNVANNNCDGLNGWEVARDHVQSGAGRSDNDYLILTLTVPGFKLPVSVRGASGSEYGRITFEFETSCSSDCEFYFMTVSMSTNVIESWDGSKSKQSYTHIMTENSSVAFTWAFQRTSQVRQYVNDMVKIYSVTVTNAMDGVASACRACALQSQQAGSSCVPCPAGHYIDKETNQCQECPPNTVLSGHHIYGKEACQPCGPGSKSNKEHSVCFSDCSFTYTDQIRTLQYDFSALTSAGSIMNGPSFTAKGTKYYHLFNISLCGAEGHKAAVCRDNVTNLSNEDAEGGQQGSSVEAFLCQSTIIPSDGRGLRTALSSQSISLADTFQGTCDGCTFHFLWESSSACPRCTAVDYHAIEGACKAGVQDTVFVWTEPRLCTGGLTLPLKRTSPCEAIDFWLKVGAGLAVFCAILLVSLTCYFWKKNKKLEFKYSKLVMSANKECELPAADSCAIMEGEGEENEEEEVVYANKSSLLAKLKAVATKEHVTLKTGQGC